MFIKTIFLSINKIRSQWAKTDSNLRALQTSYDIEFILSVMRMTEEEGLYYVRGPLAQYLAIMYAVKSDEREFRKWASEAITRMRVHSDESEKVGMWVSWVKDPHTMPLWGRDE